MATVKVRFDPIEESSSPPGLNTVQTKLKVATCFASVPMDEIPTKSSDFHYSGVRGIYGKYNLELNYLFSSKIEPQDKFWD